MPKPSFAISAPEQLSPSDGSTTSSSKLEWQAPPDPLYPSNPYRVQVDDDPGFSSASSIFRDTYKTSTTYSPELTSGTWYWRVKAKDSTGIWSDWSSTWSFILSTSNPTPTDTQSENSTYSTPSTQIVEPTPTSSSSKSNFIISEIPSSINSDQSFSISIELSLPNNPSSNFYLKGAFKKADGSNYFGFTKVGSYWIKNGSSYSSQVQINTDSTGSWSGTLEIKPDEGDSGFTGTGDYIFKVARYTSSGSGPTWSNEESINILDTQTSETDAENTISTTPQGAPATKSTPVKNSIITTKNKLATAAGVNLESTPSNTTNSENLDLQVKDEKEFNLNFLPIIGGVILIFLGTGSLVYIYYKQKVKF